MDKDNVLKFLSCIIAIVQDGQLVVKNKVGVVSHSDTSNVALVRCTSEFDLPDGTYGLEFGRIFTATNSAKGKIVDFIFDKGDYSVKYEKTKHNFAGLNLATLPSIRPTLSPQFGCIMELDKGEFNDIISVMERNIDAQKNDLMKITISYNGKLLKLRVQQDERDFVEREFELTSVEKGVGEKFSSDYPMDFLIRISNAVKKLKTETITLCFGNEFPLMVKAKDEIVEVEYMVAPRVDPT
jgi:hypothetical protein